MSNRMSLVRAALVGAISVVLAFPDAAVAQSADSTAAGTYSDAQAERGAEIFSKVCLECHARVDMSNPDFRLKWGGQSTFDLFKNIATTMPDGDPGTLPMQEYTDVVAYILKLNGIPSGAAELVSDSAVMSRAKLVLPPPAGGALLGSRGLSPRFLPHVRGATRRPHAAR